MNRNRLKALAHTAAECGRVDYLDSHLGDVAAAAARYAEAFVASQEAGVAGLLQDLGKYGHLFQRRLQGTERGFDHWSAGAWAALSLYKQQGIAAALAVQGHHIGLQKADPGSLRTMEMKKLAECHPLGLRLSESDPGKLRQLFDSDGLTFPEEDFPQ